MEVRENKSNGQRYVNIPKESKLQQGDRVLVKEIKPFNIKEIKAHIEITNDKYKEKLQEISDWRATESISPNTQYIEYVRDSIGIFEDIDDHITEYKLGNVWVATSDSYGEIDDSNNYKQVLFDFEDVLTETEGPEGIEAFMFDKNKCNIEDIKNSALIEYYIGLKETQQKMKDAFEKEVMETLGLKYHEWGGHMRDYDEFSDVWINEELGFYVKINTWDEPCLIFITLDEKESFELVK